MDVLLGVDAQALFASADYKSLLAGQPLPGVPAAALGGARDSITRGLKELHEKTGIDFERDVDRLVVALGDFAARQPKFALLALGRFAAAAISSAFERGLPAGKTLERRTVDGRTLLTLNQGGKADTALVFLGERALLCGTPGVVEAVVRNQAEGRRPLEANAGLASLVAHVDPAASMFVVVGPTAIAAMRKGAASPPPFPFPIPDALSMSARFGGGFEVVAEMPAEADARNVVDLVRGGLAALRMKLAQQPQAAPLNRVLETVEITAEGKRARLSAPAAGAGVMGVGMLSAIAIPSLVRARIAANEAVAIGDIRTVISAEAAYQSVAQGYGDLACLAKPGSCIKGYTGEVFLDDALAGATEKSGYKRAFHPGPAGKKPGTYRGFAYTATPIEAGKTGIRSFCGDATGRVCFDPKSGIVPSAGSCPQTCSDLK
jgi:hypothetical protein